MNYLWHLETRVDSQYQDSLLWTLGLAPNYPIQLSDIFFFRKTLKNILRLLLFHGQLMLGRLLPAVSSELNAALWVMLTVCFLRSTHMQTADCVRFVIVIRFIEMLVANWVMTTPLLSHEISDSRYVRNQNSLQLYTGHSPTVCLKRWTFKLGKQSVSKIQPRQTQPFLEKDLIDDYQAVAFSTYNCP